MPTSLTVLPLPAIQDLPQTRALPRHQRTPGLPRDSPAPWMLLVMRGKLQAMDQRGAERASRAHLSTRRFPDGSRRKLRGAREGKERDRAWEDLTMLTSSTQQVGKKDHLEFLLKRLIYRPCHAQHLGHLWAAQVSGKSDKANRILTTWLLLPGRVRGDVGAELRGREVGASGASPENFRWNGAEEAAPARGSE
eukprot:753674-Hanusia_phi.AAC.2